MLPRPTIEAFDRWLTARKMRFEAIVVGGSALALLGVTGRPTRDLDVLDPVLDPKIAGSARDFAAHVRREGVELADDWLNNGPIQLADILPEGWRTRCRLAFSGVALRLQTLGHEDLLKTKLFALCDRGTDLADCIALAPTMEDIQESEPWLLLQDTNPQWPNHVRATLDDLRKRLHDGV